MFKRALSKRADLLKMTFFLFIMAVTASKHDEYGEIIERLGEKNPKITVKIEEDEFVKQGHSSKFIGVSWCKSNAKWKASRHSKIQGRTVYNGGFNVDEEIKAAQASDNLARKLMETGEEGHKLNFPKDETEVLAEKKQKSSKYFGVSWSKVNSHWLVQRKSKIWGKFVYNGCFDIDKEAKAAHASDTLARALMKNGEEQQKLNFPQDETEVWAKERETSSQYFGVSWGTSKSKWIVSRRSKRENKLFSNGFFNFDEETKAAQASDTLARKLMQNGEKEHKLNFPEEKTELWAEKKETSSQYFGVCWNKKKLKWQVTRRSKLEGKTIYNGYFALGEESKAALASDTLARQLMRTGKEEHKLNFPFDETEVWAEEKPHSSQFIGVSWSTSHSKWLVSRRSKLEGKMVHDGYFALDKEMKAARASDSLARRLMKNGEEGHRLNFLIDETEVWKKNKKRKRADDLKSQDNLNY